MPPRRPSKKISDRQSGVDRRQKQVKPSVMAVDPKTFEANVPLYFRKSTGQLSPNTRSGTDRRKRIRRNILDPRQDNYTTEFDDNVTGPLSYDTRRKDRRKNFGRRVTDK